MNRKKFVIAGAGLAGVEAAAAIRGQDKNAGIVMVGEEAVPFYTRIRLPEYVAGTIDRDKLIVKKQAWYDERSIELMLGCRVESVDPSKRTVSLSSGIVLEYDRLICATGARCFIPSVPGVSLDGVIAVRSVENAAEFKRRCLGGGGVAVVGGGLLGLEMAAAISRFTDRVVVIEKAPWILARQLDRKGGELLQAILESKNIEFRTSASVDSIVGDSSVAGVRLENGEVIAARVVVVSAGIVPVVDPAVSAGCEVNRGVIVDDRMQTTVDGIYAAGDCAEHRGKIYGIWPAAEEQGKVAGSAAAGGDATYRGTIVNNRLKVTGVDVFSAGDIDAVGRMAAEIQIGDKTYRKLVHNNEGRLVGTILIGDLNDQRKIALEIAENFTCTNAG
ncbi:MAG TPA: FAD-dependent oxidoreductase [Acidobacteriota bacterium]|nr:FAD-dependent oxidoreductase [Acidobacteriota bacterium]